MICSGLAGRAGPWLTALLVTAVLGLAAPCRAQPARERATELLRTGNELHRRGDLRGALEKYRQASELYPSPRIDFNIGVTLFAMGREIEAADQLERVLGQSASVTDPAMLEGARRRIEQLRRRLGRVAVSCRVEEAALTIDGSPIGDEPFRRWIYLRPGKHRIAVTAPNHHGFVESVDLVGGDQLKLMASLAPIMVEHARPVKRRKEAPPAAAPFYKRWWFWTIVGAVVVGATVGGAVAATTGGSDRVPRGELEPLR